jgi:primosomal protein N' (replication factor Y)
MARFADVALPVAVDKEFTYLIPHDLQPFAQVGCRVIVPFGTTLATGLIVGLPSATDIRHLKPIRDIIDPVPVVSEDMLRLCQWIADYYFAPLGEVLKAAVPHGFTGPSKRRVHLASTFDPAALTESDKRKSRRVQILQFLAAQGPSLLSEIKRHLAGKDPGALVNQLAREGVVTLEDAFSSHGGKPLIREFILFHELKEDSLRSALDRTPARKKRQRELLGLILEELHRGVTESDLRDLVRRSGSSTAAAHDLIARALITTVKREVASGQEFTPEAPAPPFILNELQQHALDVLTRALGAGTPKTILLHGVTGSGKTQVYIEAIRYCLGTGRTAIVLVPEISLTPQTVRRFKLHFADDVMVVHSRMAAVERQAVWRAAQEGRCRIVVGPRSAVFAPLHNLGLIVVDEEHEASYKQYDSSPRYHARDVAIIRGTLTNIVVVLGSATPSIESYSNAATGKFELVEMPRRIEEVPMPNIAIVDMTAERKKMFGAAKAVLPPEQRMSLRDFQQPSLSRILKEKIAERIARQEGIILLQNRRGFAPFVECPDCGYVESCDHCQVTLTYHLSKKHLRCHYCGTVRQPHIECPQCHGTGIQLRGFGTQRVEKELAEAFPGARILRMDLDTTTRKGAHDRLLTIFGSGGADILLGTQMVAKGLDFPRVTLVGVISADTQMLLPDFRSSERTFQLLTQVAGRSGRSTLKGEVIIQTHQPAHPTLRHVLQHDFRGFYLEEMESRTELEYPPLSRLVLLEFRGPDEQHVRAAAETFGLRLKESPGFATILGPAPAVIGKIKSQYRWHIIIKDIKSVDPSGSRLRHVLRALLTSPRPPHRSDVHLIVDADPVGLL